MTTTASSILGTNFRTRNESRRFISRGFCPTNKKRDDKKDLPWLFFGRRTCLYLRATSLHFVCCACLPKVEKASTIRKHGLRSSLLVVRYNRPTLFLSHRSLRSIYV
uniref:Uncharacterized protein ORF106_3 n=1 Tax=Nothoceros aenigmaticus TaxID=13813 RepID=C3RYQ9_9EMBR|nr:hypothetical protein MeaeMp58 [Nothoceros aenigmaticus]ACC86815.1 hypothetical protein MeaeMp58 [Nothoceros aenigmaticus]